MAVEDLLATISDLEDRIRWLETRMCGYAPVRYDPDRLLSIYVEANKNPMPGAENLWTNVVWSLDVRQLLALARISTDPFPWKPFLLVLEFYEDLGVDVDDVRAHLLELASKLLELQGMSKVRPVDLMGTPTAIRQAIATIRE